MRLRFWSREPRSHAASKRRCRRERRDPAARELLVDRVIAEFREMPCLRLTRHQAERLFGLRTDICTRLIDMLVSEGVLRMDDEGRYVSR